MSDSKIDNILNDSKELDYCADEPTGQVTTIPLLRLMMVSRINFCLSDLMIFLGQMLNQIWRLCSDQP